MTYFKLLFAVFISLFSNYEEAQSDNLSKLTRSERWEASFAGCLSNMTFIEKIKWSGRQNLICACTATFFINRCAPKNKIKNSIVMQ